MYETHCRSFVLVDRSGRPGCNPEFRWSQFNKTSLCHICVVLGAEAQYVSIFGTHMWSNYSYKACSTYSVVEQLNNCDRTDTYIGVWGIVIFSIGWYKNMPNTHGTGPRAHWSLPLSICILLFSLFPTYLFNFSEFYLVIKHDCYQLALKIAQHMHATWHRLEVGDCTVRVFEMSLIELWRWGGDVWYDYSKHFILFEDPSQLCGHIRTVHTLVYLVSELLFSAGTSKRGSARRNRVPMHSCKVM